MKIIVDLKCISKNPGLLSYCHPNYQLVIPKCYLNEEVLLHDTSIPADNLLELMQSAIKYRHAEIALTDTQPKLIVANQHIFRLKRRIGVFKVIEECYKNLSIENDVKVLTYDYRFQDRMILPTELMTIFKNETTTRNDHLRDQAGAVEDQVILNAVKYLLIFVAVVGLASINNIQEWIKSDFWNSFALLATVLVSAWALFIFRRRKKFWYGCLEVGFGIAVAINTICFPKELPLDDVAYIKIVTSVYIIIRGFDNMEKGIQETNNQYVSKVWRKVF